MDNFLDKLGDNMFYLWACIAGAAGALAVSMLLIREQWLKFRASHPAAAERKETEILAALLEAEKKDKA